MHYSSVVTFTRGHVSRYWCWVEARVGWNRWGQFILGLVDYRLSGHKYMTPCSAVKVHRFFRELCCLHLQGRIWIQIIFLALLAGCLQMTNAGGHNTSWESYSCSASPIRRILWKWKIYYRVSKRPALFPMLRHMSPVHTFPSDLRFILILSSRLRLRLQGFHQNFYAHIFSPIRATLPAALSIRILFGEEYIL
jgi:hypothetical protein